MPPDVDRRPTDDDGEAASKSLGDDMVSIPSTSSHIVAFWLDVTPDRLPSLRDDRAEHLPRREWERLIRERPCGVGARNRYEAAVIA